MITARFTKLLSVFYRRQERPSETIPLFTAYSAIHKAAGSLVTGILAAGTTPRGRSPIDGFMDGMVKWWNSIRQSREP